MRHNKCLSTLLTIVLCLSLFITTAESGAVGHSGRSHAVRKRSILSLPRGILKFTSQIIIPVLALINQTNTYLWFDLPTTWPVPSYTNLNTLYTSFGRLQQRGIEVDENFIDEQRANHERRTVYQYLEGFFDNFGMNGKACIQRAICEMSEASLASHGLLGKVIELLLIPSKLEMPATLKEHFGPNRIRRDVVDHATMKELDFLNAPTQDEYVDAYDKGKHGQCWHHYAACPINIFKMLDI